MNQISPSLLGASLPAVWPSAVDQSHTGRWYGSAWGASCIVHGLVLAALCWSGAQVTEPPRPAIRLVFVESPPPPPAPLGAPTAEGAAPLPEQPPAVMEKPKPQTQPRPKEPERLQIVKKKKQREEPKPISPAPLIPPQPEVVPEPAPVVVASQPGVTAGAIIGTNNGVVGGQGMGPLPVAQVANPPLLLSRVTPEYPRQARVRGVAGLVLLEAILDLEGHIEDEVKVLQSIPLLDNAAIHALRGWRFRPARDHRNQPVRVILEVPVRFVLK